MPAARHQPARRRTRHSTPGGTQAAAGTRIPQASPWRCHQRDKPARRRTRHSTPGGTQAAAGARGSPGSAREMPAAGHQPAHRRTRHSTPGGTQAAAGARGSAGFARLPARTTMTNRWTAAAPGAPEARGRREGASGPGPARFGHRPAPPPPPRPEGTRSAAARRGGTRYVPHRSTTGPLRARPAWPVLICPSESSERISARWAPHIHRQAPAHAAPIACPARGANDPGEPEPRRPGA
jgi:hypothetical protein